MVSQLVEIWKIIHVYTPLISDFVIIIIVITVILFVEEY